MTTYPNPPIPPNTRLQLVDKDGILTNPGLQFLQQLWAQIAGNVQFFPTTATNTSNDYLLTTFPVGRTTDSSINLKSYADYMTFTFVAPFTSTGLVTANVNSLGDLNVYKSNGAAQATTGDIVINSLYYLTYNSNLNSSAGGFVLK